MAYRLAPSIKDQFAEEGFSVAPFPQELRDEMLRHIDAHIRELGAPFFKAGKIETAPLESIALSIPDEIWSKKMHRAFRMFPKSLTEKIHRWADQSVRKEFGKTRSAVNVVQELEANMNPKIGKDHLAIYWRCVRPGKPDAGRPHRDATFWAIELEDGYDPKIPFTCDYIKDCIKIWIPLKGCTPQTTLQIIPRSHRVDIPTVVENTEYGRRPNISNEWLQDHEKDFTSPLELSKGSCILFDMDLVHRGPTHNNRELRISAELSVLVQ